MLVGAWRARGIVAFDRDLAKGRIVVTVGLDVWAVPLNWTTGPLDRTGSVGRRTTGPNRELDTCRRLREAPLIGCGIPSLRPLLNPANLAVDEPRYIVRCPSNLVLVKIIESVG
jgi:hypothetical protein